MYVGAPVRPVLCLASASARRRELLTQIGVAHEVEPANIDEARHPEEPPRKYVLRVARAKALHVSSRRSDLPVLAADTAVVLDDEVFGKPLGREHALEMLERLSGRSHRVLTAVTLATGGRLTSALSESTVRLRVTTEAERAAYWDTAEPRDKAGGYAVQGLGAVFVEFLEGSFSGVMGLPLCETARLLRDAGVTYWPCRVRS